jgi:hypothetical protein
MRLAYELGFATGTLFSGRTMRFLSLDRTTFKLPVSVGSILRLTSSVAHTTLPTPAPAPSASAPTPTTAAAADHRGSYAALVVSC